MDWQIGTAIVFGVLVAARIRFGGPPAMASRRAETVVGVASALLVSMALALPVALAQSSPDEVAAVGLAVGALVIAFASASVDWTRASLRVAGFLALLAMAFLLVGIGHRSLAEDSADAMEVSIDASEIRISVLDSLTTGSIAADSEEPPPSPALAQAAIDDARAQLPDSGTPCDAKEFHDYAQSAEQMRAEVARYQSEALATLGDGDASKAGVSFGDIPAADVNCPDSVSIADAARAGAEAVVRSLPGQDGPPSITLEVVSWLVIVGLVVLGWRTVERRSAQQLVGPVEVTFAKAADAKATDTKTAAEKPADALHADNKPPETKPPDAADQATVDQEALFTIAVLRNVAEPTAVPGGRAAPVADFAQLVTTGASTIPTAVVTALTNIFSSKIGYAVKGTGLAPQIKGDPWRVMVRVTDVTTGEQVRIHTIERPNAEQACKEAGYWAAAVIQSRSSRVPSWMRWSPSSAGALAVEDTASVAPRDDEGVARRVKDLTAAVADNPSSGVLLQKLAEAHSLQGDFANALLMSARAVAAHPAYFVARYRMAVSATLLAEEADKVWDTLPRSQREQIAFAVLMATDGVQRVNVRRHLRTSWFPGSWNGRAPTISVPPMVNPGGGKLELQSVATWLFRRLKVDLMRVNALSRLARRSERDSWRGGIPDLFSPRGDARRWRALTRSAQLVVTRNPAAPDPAPVLRVEKLAKKGSWWQVWYNLACYFARTQQRVEAMKCLERALSCPDSSAISSFWASRDPDLQELKGDPWFMQWLAECKRNETEAD